MRTWLPARPAHTVCVCIFWFGFRVGFRKKHDSERRYFFSVFVLPSVHVNSSECLELWQCHLFASICSFHLRDDMATDTIWLSLNVCVHSSVLVLSASAFSVYSPCLFLGELIVPLETIRCLLECSSYCAWEWDWAECSYLKMQKCLFVWCVSMLHQRENFHYIIKLHDIITILAPLVLSVAIIYLEGLVFFIYSFRFFPNLYDFLSFCGTQ